MPIGFDHDQTLQAGGAAPSITGAAMDAAIMQVHSAAAAPTVNDDVSSYYQVGHVWIDTTTEDEYICLDSTTGAAVWVLVGQRGLEAVTGLASSNITLSVSQYSKNIITLAGALTANINVVFPVSKRSWVIVNNTTGSFTVTCKTSAGTGVVVLQGASQTVYGDGVNIYALNETVTTTNDSSYADNSTKAASTGWVRGAMSAIATAAGFSINLAAKGHITFPSWLGGLVLQWGANTAAASPGTAVTFDTTFPTSCFGVQTTTNNSFTVAQVGSVTVSGFNLIVSSGTPGFYWFAYGY